jgi:hypothetical protein
VFSQAGMEELETMKIFLIHGAYFSTDRREYINSLLSLNRQTLMF